MSYDNPDWGWWKKEASRRGKRAKKRARRGAEVGWEATRKGARRGAKESARAARYSADYTAWVARDQAAAARIAALERCASSLGYDPSNVPPPGGQKIQGIRSARRANRSKKPQFANYNPARVEALKQKLYGFSSALSNWNLKHHEFPDIGAWLDRNWDAPYGRDVAREFLDSQASRRSENYWGANRYRSRQDIARETDLKLRLRGTFSDLSGDESTGAWSNPRARDNFWGKRRAAPTLPVISFSEAVQRAQSMAASAPLPEGGYYLIKMPREGERIGTVWYFLQSARKRAFGDASAWSIPKSYISEEDPWHTVYMNLNSHRQPKNIKVIVLDALAGKTVGPYSYADIKAGVSSGKRG